jgi:hypothetical protein
MKYLGSLRVHVRARRGGIHVKAHSPASSAGPHQSKLLGIESLGTLLNVPNLLHDLCVSKVTNWNAVLRHDNASMLDPQPDQ